MGDGRNEDEQRAEAPRPHADEQQEPRAEGDDQQAGDQQAGDQQAMELPGDTGEPDVLLDVPVVKVEEISLEVDDLEARVSLTAHVGNLVALDVGAEAYLGKLNLKLKGVEAKALLKVRLQKVYAILARTLTTIDHHPEILTKVLGPAGEAVGSLGKTVEKAVPSLGKTVEKAVPQVGEAVRGAAEKTAPEVGKAVRSTVAQAVPGVTSTIDTTIDKAATGAQQVTEKLDEARHDATRPLWWWPIARAARHAARYPRRSAAATRRFLHSHRRLAR
ncbi:MAG: hypothetical protein ACTHU0_24380 [Kofleriaceae bacterium]